MLSGDVLIIYTGGTIGSVPKDPTDPISPLVPAEVGDLLHFLPSFDKATNRLLIQGRWIQLAIHSWSQPVDSSNISLKDWQQLARVIHTYYDQFHGFVILHGTDTMAYTASVLAFMLRNLAKPVVFTGAQLPIGFARTDAVQNLVTSIEIAAALSLNTQLIPEVTIFFGERLYRGCRTTKLNTSSFSAFASPNFPSLAEVGDKIRVSSAVTSASEALASQGDPGSFSIAEALEPNIASIELFPGMSVSLLRNMLETDALRGVVLQTFGTGNAPSASDFLNAIGDAVRRGITLIDITQCRSGEVELGLYEVSSGLLSRRVINGLDMTPEAALGKLFVILGSESDPRRAADRIQINTRGEQRQSIWNFHFGSGEIKDSSGASSPELMASTDQVGLRPAGLGIEKGVILIFGFQAQSGSTGIVEFDIHATMRDSSGSTERGTLQLSHFSQPVDPSQPEHCLVLSLDPIVCKSLLEAPDFDIAISNRGLTSFRWEEVRISLFLTSHLPVTERW